MEVHAPKVASGIGIPCSCLISLLKKSVDDVPMRIGGSHEGVYRSHHLHTARTNDRVRKGTAIRIGPADMKD